MIRVTSTLIVHRPERILYYLKADIVQKAFFGPVTPEVPASVLQLHPDCTVVADAAALSKVNM